MANRIYVVCRSAREITFGEIVEQMGGMGFLDEPARFDPALSVSNKDDTDWGGFELHRADFKPITVEQLRDPVEIRAVVSELRERIEHIGGTEAAVLQRFAEVERVLEFRLPDEVPDDVWEMLDACEGYFAKVCDGVIVAHEGVFDASLKMVLSWADLSDNGRARY